MNDSSESPNQEPARPATPKVSRLKRWLQRLALMGGTFLLCVAICEFALRLAGYGNVEIYESDPVLYWKLKPNQDCVTKIDRKPVHINSRGTRGPEFRVPKPANTLRILSLGDSRTFGWGLTEAEAYSGRLQALLQERAGPGTNVEVINAGVNAWSYPQMHLYFRDHGLKFQPDVVVLAGANLWTQFSEQNSPEFVKSFMNRVRLKNFLRRFALYHYVVEYKLKEVYERQRTKFIPVDPSQDALFKEQQQKDPDAFFRKHIEGLCGLALSNRVQPLLLFIPTLDQLSATNSSNVLLAKTQVSRRLQVPLLDLTSDLKPRGIELYMEADPVHLNAAGNEIIAQRLFESVSKLLFSAP
jgi:lysophospholipase L1-like esterase